MSTDKAPTPLTEARWQQCKHRDFSDIAMLMHEHARRLERSNAELIDRITSVIYSVEFVAASVPKPLRKGLCAIADELRSALAAVKEQT